MDLAYFENKQTSTLQLPEIFDTILGSLNYIPLVIGVAKTAIWRSKARHKNYSKWDWVRLDFQRIDKGGKVTGKEVMRHLRSNGVYIVADGYDAKKRYIFVRRSQERQAQWLTSRGLKNFQTQWRDND